MTDTGTFKVGDVVRLKSGGPAMTVGKIIDDPNDPRPVCCLWFTEATIHLAAELCEGRFTVSSLVPADGEDTHG